MRRALLAAALAATVLLAGCGSPKEQDQGIAGDGGVTTNPTCADQSDAIAHHAGAVPWPEVEPLQLAPCFAYTGMNWTYEPTLGILADGDIVVGPARQPWGTSVPATPLSSNQCQGIARSEDGGVTWAFFAPTLPEGTCFQDQTDPFLYVDPASDRAFLAALFLNGPARVHRTDDGGASWQHAFTGTSNGQTDHEMIFSGPARSSATTGFPSVVYYCAFSLGILGNAAFGFSCAKSLDGGATFLPGLPAPFPSEGDGNQHIPGYCSGGLDHGIADHEGILYIPTSNCGVPRVAISEDEGLTWRFSQVSTKLASRTYDGFAFGWTSVAVDSAGTIFYAWIADDLLPWMAVSRDHGATWSEPVNVAAPGVTEAALVQVVAGSAGRVALSYLGSSNAPGFVPCAAAAACAAQIIRSPVEPGLQPGYEATTWDAYMALLPDAGADDPAIHSVVVSGDGSDPLIRGTCGPSRCADSGEDFVDLKIGPDGVPHAVFVDRCMRECVEGGTANTPKGEVQAVVARLVGGPSLWGDADPNGPYPG